MQQSRKKEDQVPYVPKTEAEVKREQIVSTLLGLSNEVGRLSKLVVVSPTSLESAIDNITEIIGTRMESYTGSITDSITQFNRIISELGEKVDTLQEFTTAEEKGFGEVFTTLAENRKVMDTSNTTIQQIDRAVNNLTTNFNKNLEKLNSVNVNINALLVEAKKVPADIPKLPTKDRTTTLLQEQHANSISSMEELHKLKSVVDNINNDIQILKVNRTVLDEGMEQVKTVQGQTFNSLKAHSDKLVEVMRSDSSTLESKLSHILSLQQEQLTNQKKADDTEALKDELLKINALYREAIQELDIYKQQLSDSKDTIATLTKQLDSNKPKQDKDLIYENRILQTQIDKLIIDHKSLNDEFIALRILNDSLLSNKESSEEESKILSLMEEKK